MAIKYASEVKEGDTLEHARGVFTVTRVVVQGDQVSIRGVIKGHSVSPWATYHADNQFNVVTLH